MGLHRYKVTCLECGESDILTIDNSLHAVVDYEKKIKTPLRSFRWRPDLKWGFFCECNNDNRLAPQEADDMDKLVDGDPISIQRIADSLMIPDEQQFQMRAL
jgi:hypothetical protein